MKKTSAGSSAPGRSGALAVAVLVFLTFLPVLRHPFVSWDDDVFLYLNPFFRGLGWTQLSWMFTTFLKGPYQPIVWMSYAVDYLLWGMDPTGFHLASLLWHCANAALLFLLCRRLFQAAAPAPQPGATADRAVSWAAGFAALSFALHPLRVEPVAWATARRDLMSGFFFLCALLCHLKGHEEPARRRSLGYWTLACYCLSLLAKPAGIGLPLILAVLDVAFLKRRVLWRQLLPYALPAAAAAALAWKGQTAAGAMLSMEDFGWPQRLAQGFYGHAFYLAKTLWPSGLAPMYETALRFDPLAPRFLASAACAAAVAAAAFGMRRRGPALWSAWLAYLILLVPVLGAVKFGTQLVADRYSYLPGLTCSALAAAGLLALWRRAPRSRRGLVLTGACIIMILAGLSWRQLGFWKDSETLYRRVLALDPQQTMARNNLGLILDHEGRLPEALEQYAEALKVRPHFAGALNNLGAALLKLGRLDEAEAQLRAAMASDPGLVDAYNNIGLVLASRRRYAEALAMFDIALRLDPGYGRAARNRAAVLSLQQGRGR